MLKSAKINLKIFYLEHPNIHLFLKCALFLFGSVIITIFLESGFQNIGKIILNNYYKKIQYENIEALLNSDNLIEKEYGIKFLQDLAKENSAEAKIKLAQYLYDGKLIKQDLLNAKKLVLDSGLESAKYFLLKNIDREMATKEWSTTEIIREIHKCDKSLAYRDSDNISYPENVIIAMMQIECENGIKKIDAGIKNLEDLAAQKNPLANYFLGILYAEGEELPQDITMAKYYLDFACKQNIRESCNSLISLNLNKDKRYPNSRQIKRELRDIMDKLDILAR